MMAIRKWELLGDHHKLYIEGNKNPYCSPKIKSNIFSNGDNVLPSTKKPFKLNKTLKIPYFIEDNYENLPEATEKRFMQKRGNNFITPLLTESTIYKTNSDDLKNIKEITKRKSKKSVLTLPTTGISVSHKNTEGDINDSMNRNESNHKQIKAYSRPKEKKSDAGYYSKATSYCSTVDVYSSSSDFIKYIETEKKTSRVKTVKKNQNGDDLRDVWSLIRTLNRMKYRPVPSDDSISTIKKKSSSIGSKNRNGVIKSCHTEELAYIETFNIGSSTEKGSLSSDQITVINNTDDSVRSHENKSTVIDDTKDKKSTANIDEHGLVRGSRKKDTNNTKVRETYMNGNKTVGMTLKNAKVPNITKLKSSNQKEIRVLPRSDTLLSEGSSKAQLIKLKSCRAYKRLNSEPNKKRTFTKTTNNSKENDIIHIVVSKEDNTKSINIPSKSNQTVYQGKESHNTSPLTKIVQNKMTRGHIIRKLGQMRFPIVVLKKDEVSSNFENMNEYNSQQFSGLEHHIWPYMSEWYKTDESRQDRKVTGNKNVINACFRNKHKTSEFKKKLPISNEESQSVKTICQFKNKVIQMLYKKPMAKQYTEENVNQNHYNKWHKIKEIMQVREANAKKKDVSTETTFDIEILDLEINDTEKQDLETKSICERKFPLHKYSGRKWTTDFIESIMRKIKSGVYYNPYSQQYSPLCVAYKTTSCQTLLTCRTDWPSNKKKDTPHKELLIPNRDAIDAILSIDGALSTLVVKTVTRNMIEIKHCDSNVTFQFDVTESSKAKKIGINNKKSCIPIPVTDDKTKVYKSKTIIGNNMLPAEICTIIPNIMRNFLSGKDSCGSFESIMTETPNSSKTTISSISTTFIKYKRKDAPNSIVIIGGQFGNKNSDNLPCDKITEEYNKKIVALLIEAPKLLEILGKKVCLIPVLTSMQWLDPSLLPNTFIRPRTDLNSCTSLQLYVNPCERQYFLFKIFVRCMINKFTSPNIHNDNTVTYDNRLKFHNTERTRKHSISISLQNGYDNNTIINPWDKVFIFEIILNRGHRCNIGKANLAIKSADPLMRNTKFNVVTHQKDIAPFKHMCTSIYSDIRQLTRFSKRRNDKVRNVKAKVDDKSSKTSLNKIKNLKDFLKAAGLNESLINIFDDLSEKKIMESLRQMKSWLNKISQSQGLLILLLVNEKETPNLVKFQQLLLHAIATGRITKCSELRTEIEVIEREDFPLVTTCLPPCIKKSFNLFEELLVIAKTTASGCNRTLDDSAEHHLRYLLEKRSLQNPSYLRVMARYLGLGLLKFPEKKV